MSKISRRLHIIQAISWANHSWLENTHSCVERSSYNRFIIVICISALSYIPFLRLAKIVFKKCSLGKIKNTEALEVDSTFWRFIFPVMFWLLSISYILCTVEFFRISGILYQIYKYTLFNCILKFTFNNIHNVHIEIPEIFLDKNYQLLVYPIRQQFYLVFGCV